MEDKTIKVWDGITGAELVSLGHDSFVSSVAFSPDGERIVAGSSDKTVRVWDASTGAEVMSLHGHDDTVYSVVFSPDGRKIVSGCDIRDKTIKVWESATPASGYEPRRITIAARKVVDGLYEEHGSYHEVIGKLKTDETLDESVCKVALQIANARLWEDAKMIEQEK